MQLVHKLTDWNYRKSTGFIKRNTLISDIRRGVKFLSESSYSNVCGSTKSSVLFVAQVMKFIDIKKVYRVDLKHNNKHWYTVRLFTKDGYVIQLKGCSYGYYGEGSRGTWAVLNACGFDSKKFEKRIFAHGADKHTIRFFRRFPNE
jgi:hypothetical protein